MPDDPKPLAVIDVETLGKTPDYDVVDVAVIVVPGHLWRLSIDELTREARANTYHSRVIPLRPDHAQPGALEVSGYTPADWANARPGAEVFAEVAKRIKGARLVGHNLKSFDLAMLKAAFERHGVAWTNRTFNHLDTLDLSMLLMDADLIQSASLGAICQHFGIIRKASLIHTAVGDAWDTVRVLHAWSSLMRSVAVVGRRAIGITPEAQARFEASQAAA